eukprot:CAMPEP_0180089208 /NCGR_PEP_ID=MMETSP0985-20121206/22670_1 /TAXON_ID=483367 /ORGANISM="non described non described, Strain CCMP 2436" /LENGTH=41 /DNA_ID= /DNA_START= /DNA_END= /DNA_ORIENTATION=
MEAGVAVPLAVVLVCVPQNLELPSLSSLVASGSTPWATARV